jgi:hypothetical protein
MLGFVALFFLFSFPHLPPMYYIQQLCVCVLFGSLFLFFFFFFLLFPWLEETNDRFPGTILGSRLSVCVCVWRVHETAELLDALREREEEEEEEKEKKKKRELKN